jgi:cyclopropane fatty-acyl-phospholipid synthase-like methyltransferase
MRFVVTQSKVIFQCKKEMCEHYQCTFSAWRKNLFMNQKDIKPEK